MTDTSILVLVCVVQLRSEHGATLCNRSRAPESLPVYNVTDTSLPPTFPGGRFRLGGVLNGLQSLRRLHVEVRERKLDDQLWGGFGPKLTELRLTDASLRQVDPEAFKVCTGRGTGD